MILLVLLAQVVAVFIRFIVFLFSISELQAEYQDEEVTQKGYVKRLRSLLSKHLEASQQEVISQLESDLSEGNITEVSYCAISYLSYLNPFLFLC